MMTVTGGKHCNRKNITSYVTFWFKCDHRALDIDAMGCDIGCRNILFGVLIVVLYSISSFIFSMHNPQRWVHFELSYNI